MTKTQNASVNGKELEKAEPAKKIHKAEIASDAKRSVPPAWWNWRRTEDRPHGKRRGWLKNGNRPGDPRLAPRCGAKTRGGNACQAPAMPNGRCRLHGGLSTGPKTADGIDRIRTAVTKHGRYSAATKLRRQQFDQVLVGPYFKEVSEKTINHWNHEPELRASVEEIGFSCRAQFLSQRVARKQARVSALTQQFEQLWQIVLQRDAAKEMRKIPGGTSGLICKTLKPRGSAIIGEVYASDIKLSREIRRILEQIARETRGLAEQPDLRRYPIIQNACGWTKQEETAAALLAEGELSIPQIAKNVGVSEKTLDRWKRQPKFRARVEEGVATFSAGFRWEGLARKEARISVLTQLYDRLEQIVRERGFGLRTVKSFGTGSSTKVVQEYRIDAPLAGEMCGTLKQVAQELGQWGEKQELSGADDAPPQASKVDLSVLSDEELAEFERLSHKISAPASPQERESK